MQSLTPATARRIAGTIAMTVAVLAHAGCSTCGQSESPSPAQGSAVATPNHASSGLTMLAPPPAASGEIPASNALCTMVPPADVAATIGIPNLKPTDAKTSGNITLCMFGDGESSSLLVIRFESGRHRADMDQFRAGHEGMGQQAADLPGLGEAAFTFSVGDHRNVSTLYRGLLISLSSTGSSETLEALARKIIAKAG